MIGLRNFAAVIDTEAFGPESGMRSIAAPFAVGAVVPAALTLQVAVNTRTPAVTETLRLAFFAQLTRRPAHANQTPQTPQRILFGVNRSTIDAAPLIFASLVPRFIPGKVLHDCHHEKASKPAVTKQTRAIQPLLVLLVVIGVRYFLSSLRRVAADNIPRSRGDVGRE